MRRILLMMALIPLLTYCDTAEESDDSNLGEESDEEKLGELPDGIGALNISSGTNALPDVVDPVKLSSGSDVDSFDSNDSGSLVIHPSFSLADDKKGIDLQIDDKSVDFNGKSFGACEMANRARGFIGIVAGADQYACDLAFILGDTDKYYDGEPHIIEVTEDDDGEILTERIRFQIGGSKEDVRSTKIWICEDGKQQAYVSKTINDDETYKLIAKVAVEPDNPQVKSNKTRIEVEGQVNEDKNYIGLKKIINTYENVFSDDRKNYTHEVVTQSSKNFQIVGVNQEDNFDNGEPLLEKYVGFAELIDNNKEGEPYAVKNIALGDGAMIYKDKQVHFVQGWNAETLEVNNSALAISKLLAEKDNLPETPTKSDLDMSGEEVWDCSGEADLKLDDEQLVQAAKKALGLSLTEEHGEDHDGHDDDEEYDVCSRFRTNQNLHLECKTNGASQSGL